MLQNRPADAGAAALLYNGSGRPRRFMVAAYAGSMVWTEQSAGGQANRQRGIAGFVCGGAADFPAGGGPGGPGAGDGAGAGSHRHPGGIAAGAADRGRAFGDNLERPLSEPGRSLRRHLGHHRHRFRRPMVDSKQHHRRNRDVPALPHSRRRPGGDVVRPGIFRRSRRIHALFRDPARRCRE